MKKAKYYYNKHSLRYEKINVPASKRLFRILGFLTTSFVFALLILIVSSYYFDSPEEKELKRELSKMKLEYELMDKRLAQMDQVLDGLQERDDNIYRVIFEAEPISKNVRTAGYGGVNKYRDLKNYENGALMSDIANKLDKIGKQIYIQSKSYDEVAELIKNKEVMLASIPAIQPVSNKNLT
ncbi:MAG: M23 family peptidase, partial [Chitinophagales bacterium]